MLEECHQWVQLFLKDFGPDDIFFDAELEYSDGSLKWDKHGTIQHYNQLIAHRSLNIYSDPWPFHAWQGPLGDCWLIAPLMTIARKRDLLEQIIPENDFSVKHGLFLVRLFFNGEWNIVVVDGHFPLDASGGYEFARVVCSTELWPCLIEKAVAKMLGGYHNLMGGPLFSSFQYLTGASCLKINLNNETSLDMLWEKLHELLSLGYLISISTLHKFKNGAATQNGLGRCHSYSLLDICVHEGHRLVLIGGTNILKWNGKWSELPPYTDEVTEKWSEKRRKIVNDRFSWMEIDDLYESFDRMIVCKYREGWHELRTGKGIFQLGQDGQPEKILRIHIKKQCKLIIELVNQLDPKFWKYVNKVVGVINIHRTTSDNQIGDLIVSSTVGLYWAAFRSHYRSVESDEFEIEPGVYFVVYNVMSSLYPLEYSWVIRSPTPLDHISYDFVMFEYDMASHQSLLTMMERLGQQSMTEIREGLFAQEYARDNFLTLMLENHTDKPIDIIVIARTNMERVQSLGVITEQHWNTCLITNPIDLYKTIPSRSKFIFGNIWTIPGPIELKNEVMESEISCKYWIRILEEEIENGRAIRYEKVPGIYKAVPIR
ncbi:hypothetical protein GCK72_020845 [Caenorhabditis remanei]|uniref:Calpain catalytic domain-containing protein n=1 Tax=Caenorhabditis remanei TaxID=31234 RepID=A0A6A5GIA2_CAERE|nr:hypothetical protein GCK72_020845 [Caenorhabditis remanei]KAF1754285.1 hypothetical protein GCK72_020845 [Caenorhabditis remanei]